MNHSNIISEEVRKKTLLFNTFFFNKLTSKGKPGEVDVGRDKHHQKVKKWLRHDDIFSKDFLIVPVNRSKHWFLLIVCYPSNVPACVDVDFGRDPESPCIILMDSLGAVRNGGRNKLTDPLRSLLQAEWKEKRGTEKVFDSEGIPDRRIRVTVQDNYYDCGLYLLQYVEQFLKNPPAILASESNDFKDWVDRKVMSDKREKIKDIIWRMSRIQNATKAKQETSTKLEEVSEGEDEVREQVMQDVEIDPQEKMEEEEDEISEVKEEQID